MLFLVRLPYLHLQAYILTPARISVLTLHVNFKETAAFLIKIDGYYNIDSSQLWFH